MNPRPGITGASANGMAAAAMPVSMEQALRRHSDLVQVRPRHEQMRGCDREMRVRGNETRQSSPLLCWCFVRDPRFYHSQECKRLQSDTHQRILVDVMQVIVLA